LLRRGTCVRRDAGERHTLSDDAQARAADGPFALPRGMRGKGGEDPVEDAFPYEIDLSAAVLLGRGADQLDPHLEARGARRGDEVGANVAYRYQVVATAMPDIGERVVLREERDRRAILWTHARAERRFQPSDAPLDGVARALQEGGDRGQRMALLVRELGMAVDVTREQDEFGRLGRG